MLFNSIDFLIFFPIVFTIYWLAGKHRKLQNVIILLSSYVFYGWWDWRFLSLIIFSSVVDFIVAKGLERNQIKNQRKALLAASLVSNLGLLGFFKYYNFFLDNFISAFSLAGQNLEMSSLQIILPVGISFYTFQTLSYTIDVYRKKIPATHQLMDFAAYVAFFPQLVAGPIERASRLLPQFAEKRQFSYPQAVDGMRQILWGAFKKMVVADNCATYVDVAFSQTENQSAFTLILGALFFTIQIYCDFSGYSDMAIGLARLMGFRLMQNFAFPFFSRDIAEFWRRWHISLSTWFRDYLYIPLGGSRGNKPNQIRNVILVFVVSGFWHGANWTFIIWGLLNALYFLPSLLSGNNRNNLDTVAENRTFPTIKELTSIGITFSLTIIAFIFFRSDSLSHTITYLSGMSNLAQVDIYQLNNALVILLLIILMTVVEWNGRTNKHALEIMPSNKALRWAFYTLMISIIGMFMQTEETPFIYFQF